MRKWAKKLCMVSLLSAAFLTSGSWALARGNVYPDTGACKLENGQCTNLFCPGYCAGSLYCQYVGGVWTCWTTGCVCSV